MLFVRRGALRQFMGDIPQDLWSQTKTWFPPNIPRPASYISKHSKQFSEGQTASTASGALLPSPETVHFRSTVWSYSLLLHRIRYNMAKLSKPQTPPQSPPTQPNTTNKGIPGFTPIAPSIWEYEPERLLYQFWSPPLPKDTEAPSLILLCTWTGAQNRYIAKYTAEYRSLFPSARIMVIATTAKDLCFRSSRQKQRRLEVAVDRIIRYEYLVDSFSTGGILMHAFSEGGSNKACELVEAYYNTTCKRLPLRALYLDSTPGHPRYLHSCNALYKSLPRIPIVNYILFVLCCALLGAIFTYYHVFTTFENNFITWTRRRLLDSTYFDLSVPRCYLYSKNDVLISWLDIYAHAEESFLHGVPVQEVLFEKSGHVDHARVEPRRYWDAVLDTWERSRGSGEKCYPVVSVQEVEIAVPGRALRRQSLALVERRWSDVDSERTLNEAGGLDRYIGVAV
jgi:hypothetical protein